MSVSETQFEDNARLLDLSQSFADLANKSKAKFIFEEGAIDGNAAAVNEFWKNMRTAEVLLTMATENLEQHGSLKSQVMNELGTGISAFTAITLACSALTPKPKVDYARSDEVAFRVTA